MAQPLMLVEMLTRYVIALRIGSEVIAPSPDVMDKATAAVERSNDQCRFAGVPDDLNPEMLDPARVRAFLASLPAQSAGTLKSLGERTLYLNAQDLNLSFASAPTAADLQKGYTLVVPSTSKGGLVQAKLTASVDPAAVLPRIEAAKKAMGDYDHQVRHLEHRLAQVDTDKDPQTYVKVANELGDMKYRRFLAAATWRGLSGSLSAAHPKNKEWAAQAKQAAAMAVQFAVPARHGGSGNQGS